MTLATNMRALSIRKTTVAFASLFKDINLIRYNEYGIEVERVKVPIVYSNKEKYVKRMEGDPGEIDKKVQITLPRIEYGLLGIQYDLSRKTNQANKLRGCAYKTSSGFVNSPMPYNYNFELTIYTRNIEDANQIIEYIAPFFSPDYNIKLNMLSEIGILKNIPITFNGVVDEQDSTGVFDSQVRSVFRTLSFTARSFIFGTPIIAKQIYQSEGNISPILNDGTFSNSIYSQIIVKPNTINITSNSTITTVNLSTFKANTLINKNNVTVNTYSIIVNELTNVQANTLI